MAKNSAKAFPTSLRKQWLRKLQPNGAKQDSGSPQTLKITIDTNIWFSAIVFGGKPETVVLYCLENHTVVGSVYIIDELMIKLKLKTNAPYRWLRQFRLALTEKIELVDPGELPALERDPYDTPIIATAIAGECEWLISGDHDLLDLGSFEGINSE